MCEEESKTVAKLSVLQYWNGGTVHSILTPYQYVMIIVFSATQS